MYLPFLFYGNNFLKAQAQKTQPKEIPGVKTLLFWGGLVGHDTGYQVLPEIDLGVKLT